MPEWIPPKKIESFVCDICGDLAPYDTYDVCFICKQNICENCISDKTVGESNETLCVECG